MYGVTLYSVNRIYTATYSYNNNIVVPYDD